MSLPALKSRFTSVPWFRDPAVSGERSKTLQVLSQFEEVVAQSNTVGREDLDGSQVSEMEQTDQLAVESLEGSDDMNIDDSMSS